jgi:apolipoprotein N-acyltransferase
MPNSVQISPGLSFGKALLLGLCTAGLLWASFFPMNIGVLAWVALAPMLLLVRAPISTRKAAAAVWLAGLLCNIVTMEWIRIADPRMYASWIGLSFYCSLYFPLTLWLLRRLDRMRWPLTLTVPLIWVPLEYFKAHFLTGFAWYFLGHAQHDYLALVQITDVTGVYGVSFLVAAGNGLAAELLSRSMWIRAKLQLLSAPTSRLAWQGATVAVLVLLSAGYGLIRMNQANFTEGPTVALLQSNIDQRLKNSRHLGTSEGVSAAEYMYLKMAGLTLEAKKKHANIDLMIWPETACPYDWKTMASVQADDPRRADWEKYMDDRSLMVKEITHNANSNVLVGINADELTAGERGNRYNSALLVSKDGTAKERYDKMHCVPFGEYVPLRQTLPFMSVFVPYDFDYSLTSGTNWTRFKLPTEKGEFTFGAIICYEDSDPLLARRYVCEEGPDRPPVDFLVNMSNDGWFDGHPEHEQHLAICRFRAIESRRAVLRSVNMGISAVIDGNGKIVALPASTWGQSKKISAVVVATVPVDRRSGLYARFGDWFPASMSVLAVLGLALTLRRSQTA